MTIAPMFPGRERPVLIRGFLVATGIYLAGHLVLRTSITARGRRMPSVG